MQNERILVVDDDANILEACKRILERNDFRVTVLERGRDAFTLLGREDFDILLTDIRMPDVSGLDILKAFKEKNPNSAAVVISGVGTMDLSLKAMGIGADGFVAKPFSKATLLNSVNAALGKVRLVRENVRLKSILPLFEVSKSLIQKVDMDELLKTVIDVSRKESSADAVSIMLKGDTKGLAVRSVAGEGCDFDIGLGTKREGGPAWEVMENGLPLLLQEGDLSAPHCDLMNGSSVSSALILPLKAEGEALGVMSLTKLKGNMPHFSKGDQDFMSILAGQAATALKNSRLVEGQKRLFMSIVKSLSAAIDTKSPWTAGHSERVTAYALLLGKELGFGDHDLENLELAGILHDIGKIGTHEDILNKPGRLSDEEYAEMKMHPAAGAEIISHIEQMQDIVPAIRHHHEWFDGRGYPDGKKGDDIPAKARVLAIADAFDAMKADRPYRKGKNTDVVVSELKRCSGGQFDPGMAEAMIGIVENEPNILCNHKKSEV